MTETSAQAVDYRRALNALRGFAAVYVVLYHLRYFSGFDWFGNVPVLRFGYIGVDFFFILSGLIISHVYLDKSRTADTRFWFKFIWLRLARLLPVHMLIMLLLLAAALVGPVFDPDWRPVDNGQIADWFSLTFLVRQWFLPDAYAWNSPAWSVSAELFAYLFVFPVACRVSRNRSQTSGLALVLAGALLWSLLIGMTGTVNSVNGAGPLIRVVAGFLAGSGLFIMLNPTVVQHENNGPDWDRILKFTLLASAPIWILALALKSVGQQPDGILIAYLGWLICAAYRAKGRTSDILGSPPLFWLGEISFALYLCHVPVMSALSYSADIAGVERGAAFGIICLMISMITAHFLFHYIELPSREKLRRWYERNDGSAGSPAPAKPLAN